MQLVNEFSVAAPLDVAWSALTDIPQVISCVPGAELDSHDGDDYQARVAVKVGPVGLTLAGTATVASRDDAAHSMVVRGSARDRKGNGSAEATVTITARDDAGASHVTVTTDLDLGGRIAQFGSGVISQVSNRILKQFVTRLNAQIAGPSSAEPGRAVDTGVPIGSPRRAGTRPDAVVLVVTAAAGVALGLAIGRTARRLTTQPT